MKNRTVLIVAFILSLLLLSVESLYSNIIVEPYGFGVELEQDDQAEIEILLINDFEAEISFRLSSRLFEDGDERIRNIENREVNEDNIFLGEVQRLGDSFEGGVTQENTPGYLREFLRRPHRGGPYRDDPGDVLAEYESGYNWMMGLAWDEDNGYLWGLRFHNQPLMLIALDPDEGEVVEEFEINVRCKGMFIRENVLYGDTESQATVHRWDTDGEYLGAWQSPPGQAIANNYIATDGELYFANTQGAVQVFQNFLNRKMLNK